MARACARLHARLRGAATRIQSWIRKTIAVRRFQPLIERGLLERQARRIQEQMAGIRATILLQSAFRRRLARRRVEEVRRLQQQREEPKQDWFDSERPLSPLVRPWSSASAVQVSSKSFCRPGSPGTLSVYAAETTQSGWRPRTTSRGSPDTDLGWGMRETPEVDLDPGWRPRTRGTPDDDPGGPLSPHQSWRTPPPSGRVSPRYSLRTPGRSPTPGGDLGMRTTDSWKPGDSRPVDFNAVTTHKSEFELDKLDDSGLVPFYWSQDSELVRHRVGGPVARKMERWLAADDSDGGGPEELSGNEFLWDVYPEGTSKDLLVNLDEDAWPPNRRGQIRTMRRRLAKERGERPRQKVAARKRSVPESVRRKLARPPPSNVERRAKAREEAREAAEQRAAKAAEAANFFEVLHPLLENGPLLPKVPVAPSGPPPKARRPAQQAKTGQLVCVGCEEESWGWATSFQQI